MSCEICGKPVKKNSVVCSERCQWVRLKKFELSNKYFPTKGCANCWGDLHQGCTAECVEEFRKAHEFSKDLWSLIRIIYPKPAPKERQPKK